MKKIAIALLSLNIISSMAFAEIPHAKRLVKTEGKGQFVKTSDGRQFCTHENTTLAFAESNTVLGMDVLNKTSLDVAQYFFSDLSYTTNLKGVILEKSQGSSEFPKFILINTSTYYFNSLSEVATAEVDSGFMFKRIYDTNKGTSTLYCSKK